jgi:hypothetical protein
MTQPLPAYLNVQAQYDRELARVLEQAARDIRARVAAIKPGVGGKVRAAQLNLALKEITAVQTAMWGNGVQGVIGRGRQASVKAAENAAETLSSVLYRSLPRSVANAVRDSVTLTASSGLRSDAVRAPKGLSRRVYHNAALASGAVEQTIRAGLVAGLSAKELASNVYKYISPTTPGGASYAASRLARTEINNAFHQRQINSARNRPGVNGVKWNLSGSHGKPDVCNQYAAHKPYTPDMVPDKPHPHCLCFLTYDVMSPEDFAKALERGEFDHILDVDALEAVESNPTTAVKSTINHANHNHGNTPRERALCRKNGGTTERGWPPKTGDDAPKTPLAERIEEPPPPPPPRRVASSTTDPIDDFSVRPEIAKLKTTEQVQDAFQREFDRITGQQTTVLISTPVDTAANKIAVDTAKEYAEGILRMAERFPKVPVNQIGKYTDKASNSYAHAYLRQGIIEFNTVWGKASSRSSLLMSLRRDVEAFFHPPRTDNVMSIVMHEFGHVMHATFNREFVVNAAVKRLLEDFTARGFNSPELQVSRYAAKSMHELVAEAMADVAVNGKRASEVSRGIWDIMVKEYEHQVTQLRP